MVRKPNPKKRELFLHAALKLFVANGVQNASTAAIAREAGTAAGTLFLYFPTKQDLVDELASQIIRGQSEAIQANLNSGLTAKESFSVIWEGSIRWFLANMDSYLYIQQVRDTGLLSEAILEQSNQAFAFYYQAIQKGLAEATIKPYPVDLIGEMLYRAIVAIMNLARTQTDESKIEGYIQSGFDIFWNGIKKDKA